MLAGARSRLKTSPVAGQAGGTLRRQVPDHRLCAVQLHQLRLRRIGVLTQYKSHSLIRHLQRAWGFMRPEIGEFVEIIPAQQRLRPEWYQGTDAIYQNLDIVYRHEPDYVLVLGGDHIYTMNYAKMLAAHVQAEAELTIGCIEVPADEAKAFGVMSVDEDYRITRFAEKPTDPECIPGKPGIALASMGVYIFSMEFLTNCVDP